MLLQPDLKQQLSDAISARKALEHTYERQFKLLGQFVQRLSFLCKGVDLELDNRLAKLRTELARSTDLEKLLPFVEETSEHIRLLEQRQQHNIKQAQNELTQAGRLLQRQRGLPDQLRRDLRELLSQVEQPTGTLQAFLPHLSQLTQLYQLALKAGKQLDQPDSDDERLQLEFKRWQRFSSPLCIVLADVDYFKNINDTYGHSAGDKTLRIIAKTLQRAIRQTDFIARYGGEEFVILLPDSELMQLLDPLNQLREKVKNIPFKFKNKKVTITISLGATQLKAGDTIQQAFERADEALYQAKKAGRDQLAIR